MLRVMRNGDISMLRRDRRYKVEHPCVLQKALGEPQGRSGKKYGKQLQTLHLKRQNMAPYLVRQTEIWKKYGGKYGGLALNIMGLRCNNEKDQRRCQTRM
jgi:hypothetical protein